MRTIDLGGVWRMRRVGDSEEFDARVPGGVAETLIAHSAMDDPYWRDNEAKVQDAFRADYEFERVFSMDAESLGCDSVVLVCEGLDTLAAVFVNDTQVGSADNMHRTWQFGVKGALREGENVIRVRFSSAAKYIEEHPARGGRSFASIRKAACMFGWDWGLSLPDMGIWRDIRIEASGGMRIYDVKISQHHAGGSVSLTVNIGTCSSSDGNEAELELADPDGEILFRDRQPTEYSPEFNASIEAPRLWWPVGYGDQPIYRVTVRLLRDGAVLDEVVREIGLCTIDLNRGALPDGHDFRFVVNGKTVYFKGTNLIIPDAILGRADDALWLRFVSDCVRANMNGIRVWGGAYYPPDCFFDACDRAGLLVWQDFMFACTFYPTSKAFLKNVTSEVIETLKRIAHHPCLALLCGNNETDFIYTVLTAKDAESNRLRRFFGVGRRAGLLVRAIVRRGYLKLFANEIALWSMALASRVPYVTSSPTVPEPLGAKSFFAYLSDGDMHYYLQYDGNAPYQKMRTLFCRFMSEMGFQSYPSMKTIAAFTEEADRGPDTPIMLAHQKCKNGNETIELYMARDYVVPKDFADYVYLSQLQAGEILKYSVEHMRRTSWYNNGVILWQLNDCWPVVSWSGVDYFGRWKAQQYYTKRFYAPVLVSALDGGTKAELWVTNNSPHTLEGTLRWKLCDNAGDSLGTGEKLVRAEPGKSGEVVALDCTAMLTGDARKRCHLEYELEGAGRGAVLFVLPKDFEFAKPHLTVAVAEDDERYLIDVRSDCFVKGLMLDTSSGDCVFSDNFFDLTADAEVRITAEKGSARGIADVDDLRRQLFTLCLNDVMLRDQE